MSVLLIIAAACGLLIVGLLLGRYYVPDTRPLKRAAKEGAMYIRGLNHVLAHDNDAAIAELTKAVSKHTGTVDTYLALGMLFRERGEYERAVRVHQSVLVRGGLDRRMRHEARFQLGLDFEAAGFHRRARKAFEDVLKKAPRHNHAAEKLLSIYEELGEWDLAQKALVRVEKVERLKRPVHRSHLLAEQALDALEAGENRRSKRLVNKAMKAHPGGVHPLHVSALILRAATKPWSAAKNWERAIGEAPDLAGFFFPYLEEAYDASDSLDALAKVMDGFLVAHPTNLQLRMMIARAQGKQDQEKGLSLIRDVIHDAPSLLPARRLAGRLVLAAGDAAAIEAEYKELLETLERIERDYRCSRCGHTDKELFWRCPRCHSWDSVRVAWGRRSGEGGAAESAQRSALPYGPDERRSAPRPGLKAGQERAV